MIIKDESAFKIAMKDVNKTLERLEEEIVDSPGSWTLGISFSALDMYLAVIVHELASLGYQNIFTDKPGISRLSEKLQFNYNYLEVMGPIMNNDIGHLGGQSGSLLEEGNSNSEPSLGNEDDEGINKSQNLEEKKKNRQKASEDRSWYNLW